MSTVSPLGVAKLLQYLVKEEKKYIFKIPRVIPGALVENRAQDST